MADARPHRPAARAIRSARDLHETLSGSDPRARLEALLAVARAPEAALAFGLHEGRDAVGMVLDRARAATGQLERLACLRALAAFRDPRVRSLFVTLIATEGGTEVLFEAAGYLAREPADDLAPALSPVLMQDASAARARAAAQVLARAPGLGVAERLRLALAAMDGPEAPPLDGATSGPWLAELAGPFANEARAELVAQGEPAFRRLAAEWWRLDEGSREWLVGWGVETHPGAAAGVVALALASGSDALALAALERLADAGGTTAFPTELARLADHDDPAIRLAAVAAGAARLDWRARLARETDAAMRAACLTRLAAEEGTGALPEAVSLLADDDWRVRSAAAGALALIGPAAIPAVRALLGAEDDRVRAAAARVLSALHGDGPQAP